MGMCAKSKLLRRRLTCRGSRLLSLLGACRDYRQRPHFPSSPLWPVVSPRRSVVCLGVLPSPGHDYSRLRRRGLSVSGQNPSLALTGVARLGEGGGLVPSKTSFQTTFNVNLSAPSCAERRVKRLKRSVWASGHLHGIAPKGFRPAVAWFVTLTYKGVSDWRADHISEAINRFRLWCRARKLPCRYTWVGELQQRGAVHYHLLAWLPEGLPMPLWDKPTRNLKKAPKPPFWCHGMTNTQIAKSGVGYLMKYLSKLGELTVFPKGMRLYGIGGLDPQARAVRTWFNFPEWAKREYGVGDLARKSFGLVVRATGEILAPAFSCTFAGGGLVLKQLRELPERFHAGVYSTFPRVSS